MNVKPSEYIGLSTTDLIDLLKDRFTYQERDMSIGFTADVVEALNEVHGGLDDDYEEGDEGGSFHKAELGFIYEDK